MPSINTAGDKLRNANFVPVRSQSHPRMSVLFETSLGDIVIDLEVETCPKTCENFLKLCKIYYYNLNAFFNGQSKHPLSLSCCSFSHDSFSFKRLYSSNRRPHGDRDGWRVCACVHKPGCVSIFHARACAAVQAHTKGHSFHGSGTYNRRKV